MLTEKEILDTLDNTYSLGTYYEFAQLGHPYSYLIDCRLNVFKGEDDKWAIAIERLGFNPRGGIIELQIFYYGNCLINLESYNGQLTNSYVLSKVDTDSFFVSINGEALNADATHWMVAGVEVPLSLNKADYLINGIELNEFELGEINVEEAARLVVNEHRDLFRATDEELCKSIPQNLQKILVLDEWHHRDFLEIEQPAFSDEHLKRIYEFNKGLGDGLASMDLESFEALARQQQQNNADYNAHNRTENSPGSYETWQQLAKVILSGDPSLYQPTLTTNTHWQNWPDSGIL